jgi:hypothetical protein
MAQFTLRVGLDFMLQTAAQVWIIGGIRIFGVHSG